MQVRERVAVEHVDVGADEDDVLRHGREQVPRVEKHERREHVGAERGRGRDDNLGEEGVVVHGRDGLVDAVAGGQRALG